MDPFKWLLSCWFLPNRPEKEVLSFELSLFGQLAMRKHQLFCNLRWFTRLSVSTKLCDASAEHRRNQHSSIRLPCGNQQATSLTQAEANCKFNQVY